MAEDYVSAYRHLFKTRTPHGKTQDIQARRLHANNGSGPTPVSIFVGD
jgi:hypothetical protein